MKRLWFIALCLLPASASADWAPEPFSEDTVWDCVEAAGPGWHDGAVCIGQFSAACIEDSGQTGSIPVAQCMEAEMRAWDGVLNTAYGSLRDVLATSDALPVATEALRDAQRAWIPFRDAECLSRGNLHSGTGHFEDGAECLLRVTATRALDLIGYGGGR